MQIGGSPEGIYIIKLVDRNSAASGAVTLLNPVKNRRRAFSCGCQMLILLGVIAAAAPRAFLMQKINRTVRGGGYAVCQDNTGSRRSIDDGVVGFSQLQTGQGRETIA